MIPHQFNNQRGGSSVSGLAEYRDRTAKLVVFGDRRMCAACKKPSNPRGGANVRRAGSFRLNWVCSGCKP